MNSSFNFARLRTTVSAARRSVARLNLRALVFCLTSLAVISFSLPSFAAISVTDAQGASGVDGLNTATVIIYGGVAGASCGGATDSTCSSCLANVTGGNGGLLPCNDHRINGNLVLHITVKSSTLATGYPIITTGTTTGSTTTAGNVLAQTGGSIGSVAMNQPGTINVPWSQVCANMTVTATAGSTTTGGVPTNCVLPTGSNYAVGQFNVGLSQAAGISAASGDDTLSVKIVLASGDATSPSLSEQGSIAITYYEVVSGDNKGTIKNIKCTLGSGYPNAATIPFRYVRVLWEERPESTKNTADVWSVINPGSPHTDLTIGASTGSTTGTATGTTSGSCDGNNLNLSPIEFTGGTAIDKDGHTSSVGIANNHVYDTKIASVDAAGNVGYYTPSDEDQDCDGGAASRSSGTNKEECHTIHPAAVVGVLAKNVNCFIATASYGSPMASEVDTFRHFRNTYLLPTKLGLKFVRWYYNNGAYYAHFIAGNETYRAIARAFLWLPLQFAKISMNYGIFAGLSFLFLAFTAPIAAAVWAFRHFRRRSTRQNV